MSQKHLDGLKNSVASEMGIRTGADVSSRENGRVGGEMVRRLIRTAETQLR